MNNIEILLEKYLSEGVGQLYKDFKSWSNEATRLGHKVMKVTHPSGGDEDYHVAKDRYGNRVGLFDSKNGKGKL